MPTPRRNLPDHSPLLRLVKGSAPPRSAAGRISVRVADLEDDLTLWAPKPERGKSCLVHTRVSYEVEELIDFIISRRLGEWETRNDFLRSAVSVLLTLIQDASPEVFQAHQYLSVSNDLARVTKRVEKHDKFFSDLRSTAQAKAREEGPRAAASYLKQIKRETQRIKTRSFSEAWRRFFLRDREVKKLMGVR